jgi:hypothetical protein
VSIAGAKPLWMLTAALTVALALGAPADAAKKKGKKGPGTVDLTQVVNTQVPDRGTAFGSPRGSLVSTITVGKQFNGRRIRDVNVTVQTTGMPAGGLPANGNVILKLIAPNGANTILIGGVAGDNIGPLTLDDETLFDIGVTPGDPTQLGPPYQGTAQPAGAPLFAMDDGVVSGTWTLYAFDQNGGFGTYVLNFWRINVIAGRPYKTK